jgi:hypothetical protein
MTMKPHDRDRKSAWEQFAAEAERSSVPGFDPLVSGEIPLTVYVPHRKALSPLPLLYFTKDYLVSKWLARENFAVPANVVVRQGVPSEQQCLMVRTIAKALGTRVAFVGDLDPLDLTIFAALRAGSSTLRRNTRTAAPVFYAGIDDGWLAACERHATRGKRSMLIGMSDAEREHLAVLERSRVSVSEVAGPRCARLLASGWKLELEGASNPALYGPEFLASLERRLLRRAAAR